jgi:hypothetical protein
LWQLQRCPAPVVAAIEPDLRRLGAAVVGELQAYGDDAEANLPRLEQYDAFGHRVDRLVTAEGWRRLHDVAAREGLVATAYERTYGPYSRLYQVAKVWTRADRRASPTQSGGPPCTPLKHAAARGWDSYICLRLRRRCTAAPWQ